MYEDNIDYARQRLHGTIVRHEGVPVTVNEVGRGRGTVLCAVKPLDRNLPSRTVPIGELDLTPVPLGFCNMTDGLGYLARMPLRNDWRQGLRNNNYRSLWGSDARAASNAELHKCIVGEFPDIDEALDNVIMRGVGTAFHRDWAIGWQDEQPVIAYKWFGIVGDIVNGRINLKEGKDHFQQPLDEALAA